VDVAVAGPNFKCAASPVSPLFHPKPVADGQSLAWLIRNAAQQVQAHPDGSSVWDTKLKEEDWKSWRVLGDELELNYEDKSETEVKPLGYIPVVG
jgi:hypothetical protein